MGGSRRPADDRPAAPVTVSPAFLIPLGVSAVLGVAGGMAFRWAGPEQAWNILTAAFLWTLIAAAGTTIGRFAGERVRRGNWRHGMRLALTQSFPLTTVFVLAAAVAGARGLFAAVPVLYGCTLVVGLSVGALGVLTSPWSAHKGARAGAQGRAGEDRTGRGAGERK